MATNGFDVGRLPSDAWQSFERVIKHFEDAWRSGQQPAIEDFLPSAEAERSALRVELVHVNLEYRLQGGQPVRVERYLERYPELAADQDAIIDLITSEFSVRCQLDPAVEVEEYSRRFPQYQPDLQSKLEEVTSAKRSTVPETVDSAPPCDDSMALPDAAEETAIPDHLGRYRITAKLGSGGFGVVYKGYDDDLEREVAIKVPHRHRISSPKDVATYLEEARVLARLDHPGIVPAYDVGRTEDGRCYLVSKFVAGRDLVHGSHATRPSHAQRSRDRCQNRGRPAPRASKGPDPPRHQAGQHPDRLDGRPRGGRLRASTARRGFWQGPHHGRHPGLHEP